MNGKSKSRSCWIIDWRTQIEPGSDRFRFFCLRFHQSCSKLPENTSLSWQPGEGDQPREKSINYAVDIHTPKTWPTAGTFGFELGFGSSGKSSINYSLECNLQTKVEGKWNTNGRPKVKPWRVSWAVCRRSWGLKKELIPGIFLHCIHGTRMDRPRSHINALDCCRKGESCLFSS